jgi:4-hydroxy-3-polyprenylbenzoate decarboxylase
VDPRLEITEIATRVVKQGGPALLFEKVKGSPYPLAINLMGTEQRLAWALGASPGEFGSRMAALAQDIQRPRLSALLKHGNLILRALRMIPRRAPGPPVTEKADLGSLPVLHCWPEDGGPFITWPLVITRHPVTGRRNVGLYRLQVFGPSETGLHWQIQKGGGFHYHEAEARGEPLPVAVVLGADPVTMLAGILPLPEDADELPFAGFLRGSAPRLTRLSNGLEVPANAEFILEGWARPGERREEGPFGDHFGHYSHSAPFPVFHVEKVHRRRHPITPAAVVGKPPQEDRVLGNAVQEMFLPLLKLMKPELTDLWTYFEAGFHNLAVAAVKQRYQKEAVKTALGLFGEGQMSLTKCCVLVDPGVNVRDFGAVLAEVRRHFDPRRDLILIPGTAQDTLDFTGPAMNLGSKMIWDATSFGKPAVPAPEGTFPWQGRGSPPGLNIPEIQAFRNWGDALLAVQVKEKGRETLERLIKSPSLERFKWIAVVSPDVPLEDDTLLIWGLFTRFDCARDVVPASVELRGAWPVYHGPMGIDAAWKAGYPAPLAMPEEIISLVDHRWEEYGLR